MSKCPKCESIEVEAQSPRTVYECGSSDYDQRQNTFIQSEQCKSKEQQSPEPEQQQKKSFCLDEEGGERCERQCQPCREVDYLDSKQQPPSESEREKIINLLRTIFDGSTGEFFKDYADFILSRDKEKDAEIERLKNTIHLTYKGSCGRDYMHLPLNEAVGKITSDLRAENERLKGEREEHAIGAIKWLSKNSVLSLVSDEWRVGWRMLTSEQAYTEYLNSNNK